MLNLSGEARREEIQRLLDIKEQFHDDVERLEAELDQASAVDSALRAAAGLIETSRLREVVLYSRGTLEYWDLVSLDMLEEGIQDRLQAIRAALGRPTSPVVCPEFG